MRLNAAGEDRYVVAPFQNTDDPTPRVGRGHFDDGPRQIFEVLGLQTQVANRVLGVGIEARADQHQLGPQLVGEAFEASAERRPEMYPGSAVMDWQVARPAQPASGAGL